MSDTHAVRPLPPIPNLEFERKEAKKLLRRLRAGDPQAQLADAQLLIAREYGFASWPKLVRYFTDAERLRHRPWPYFTQARRTYDGTVQWLTPVPRNRKRARVLSAYVPRFYGMPLDTLADVVISEDEARLATARMFGFASWDALAKRSDEDDQRMVRMDVGKVRIDAPKESIYTYAISAMRTADLAVLKELVAHRPELLEPKDDESGRRGTLLYFALGAEKTLGVAAMQPIMHWLAKQGFDLKKALQVRLCGTWPGDRWNMNPETVRSLLDRGADPNWVAPNRVPVLEHALLVYRNREAVDTLAGRARRRDALWIAAGLGDVEGVAAHLDRAGAETFGVREPAQLRGSRDTRSHDPASGAGRRRTAVRGVLRRDDQRARERDGLHAVARLPGEQRSVWIHVARIRGRLQYGGRGRVPGPRRGGCEHWRRSGKRLGAEHGA
jgi:hypothetical protein